MNTLARLVLTLATLAFSLLLIPVVLVILAVASWRTTAVLQQYRARLPIEGQFRREHNSHRAEGG